MISSNSTRSSLANSSVDHGSDARRAAPAPSIWTGFLHEFRNHISAISRTTNDLRADGSAATARASQLISETERNLHGLTSLVALVDASVSTGELVIARLGDVVDRAIRLARSTAGASLAVTTRAPRDTGVRNRGAILESLLGALVLEAARLPVARGDDGTLPRVMIDADVGRRGLELEVAREGGRIEAPSWRLALASDLAARLDATLVAPPGAPSYLVQFH